MDSRPVINREQRRRIAAFDRRANRAAFGACGTSCASQNGGFSQYAPVISTMGRMFGNEAVVTAAHGKGNAPLINEAAKLAGATALALEAIPPADRLPALAEATNPQFANEVNSAASKMPRTMAPPDRSRFALMIILIPAAGESGLGYTNHRTDAFKKLSEGLKAAIEGALPKKPLSGLSGLGRASLGFAFSTRPFQFSEVPSSITTSFQPNDVFYFAAQFANDRNNKESLASWVDQVPPWIASMSPEKQNAFRLAAFAVGRLPELTAPVNLTKAFAYYGPLSTDLANNSISDLQTWAVNPPPWRRDTKENTFASALTSFLVGFKKSRNVAVCGEPIKSGADWITEDCEVNATEAGDRDARNRKIALVQRAWSKAFPTTFADNCTINYYTHLKYCSEETYIAVMKAKEAAGRPAPSKDELERGFGDTAVGGALNAATDFFKNLGDKIVEYIAAAADAASAAFCKGFKALMGETVGGVFCAIFDVIFKLISGALKTVFTIIIQALTAVVEFIKELLQANFLNAIMVLFKRVNTIVILAIGGPLADLLGIPFTKGDARRLGKAEDTSFEGLGERLTDKDPLFTVNLAFAIVNVVLAATATGLSAGVAAVMLKTAIGGLVMVLGAAIGIVFAPQLMKLDQFKDVPKDMVEKGLTLLVKLLAMVVMAVMTISDLVKKLKDSVTKWYENMKDKVAGAGGAWAYLKDNFGDIFTSIRGKLYEAWDQCKKWPIKFSAIGDIFTQLAKALPIMLIAIVDDGEGTLKEITTQATTLYNEAAKDWKEAKAQWETISKTLTPEEKARALKPDIDAAVTKAQAVASEQATQAAEQKYRAQITSLQNQLATAQRPQPVPTGGGGAGSGGYYPQPAATQSSGISPMVLGLAGLGAIALIASRK
jgi:hypothetical protein